jgi:ribonuclease HI
MTIAYIDGSYDEAKEIGSYGILLVDGNGKETMISGLASIKNGYPRGSVAAELSAASIVMQWAVDNGIESLMIVHDCESVSSWATRNRGRASKTEAEYKQLYCNVSEAVEIQFKRIKSHIGNKYHDIAETLARKELGLNVKKTILHHIGLKTN